jgi:ribosomal protein S20
MAHSLSAKKRVRQNAKKRLHNRARKNSLRTQVKRLNKALWGRAAETKAAETKAAETKAAETKAAETKAEKAAAAAAEGETKAETKTGESRAAESKAASMDPVKEFRAVQKRLDRLAAKGVLHPNTAARHKSRLARKLGKAKPAPAAASAPAGA